MYLLDTNICIAIIKENPQAIQHFQHKYQDCYLTSLVLAELYKGVYCSTKINNTKHFINIPNLKLENWLLINN